LPCLFRFHFALTLTRALRKLVRRSRDPDQTRRLLALAEIYDGRSRSDAAQIGGVGVQIVRDWVLRFNAEGPLVS
jgi:transposase